MYRSRYICIEVATEGGGQIGEVVVVALIEMEYV